MKTILQTEMFEVAADEVTGSIRSFRLLGRELLAQGHQRTSELALNGSPIDLRVTPHAWTNLGSYPSAGDPVNETHGCHFFTHYTGFGVDVTRSIRATRPNQIHLTYTLQRTKIRTLPDCPGPGWGAIEAPCHLTSVSVPCLPWVMFGQDTRVIAFNTGSAGPRNHLGYENGPVGQVKADVDTLFRRQYAGVMGFPGAIFYDARTRHWIAISCRRPAIAYQLNHRAADAGVAFDFLPIGELKMNQTVQLPLVTLHAGRTREEMERFIASFMSTYYEEPAEWFWHTTWFELAINPESFGSWGSAHQAAALLTENNAVSGLFLTMHGRNLAFGGTSPNSAGPCDELGSRGDFERMIADLKHRGVRLMVWMSSCGMCPQGEADPDWFVRGSDGDFLSAWGLPHQPHIAYINHLHPGYLAYVRKWMEYYLGELGIDSIFFDCAGFSYPCDFAPRSFMRYPSDVMLGNIRFFDWVREAARKIRPDAVIMTEGHCFDAFSNVTSLNNVPAREDGIGQRDRVLGFRHAGGKRFAVRSGMEGDLGSGYVVIEPGANYSVAPDNSELSLRHYEQIGRDPFNIALTRLVGEHGSRDAVNLPCGGGVSLLRNLLFVPQPRHDTASPAALVPTQKGAHNAAGIVVTLPAQRADATTLRDIVTGATIARDARGGFVVRSRGIFEVR